MHDQQATPGGYARVHLQPKRFPVAYKVDWPSRVLHKGPNCIVVDKPPGMQVGGSWLGGRLGGWLRVRLIEWVIVDCGRRYS